MVTREGFTVAVKFAHEKVRYCGFYNSKSHAQSEARKLRASWKVSRLTSPTSIRVRKITEEAWNANK